ncbi:malonyl-[acyl-carrier protein] O-methyltransferase BioC [Gammaproteobacteria bacterium 42_54_T18]|nr:malonyl-[acyl-carrier protein] O-methyltransferase BioC [Gammaproteobacteria bacterium 42_54_T18]
MRDDIAHDKHAIAKSFGNAAKSYDNVAGLQQRVGNVLLGFVRDSMSRESAPKVLDLGCGTGYVMSQLVDDSELMFALDIAEGMLGVAKFGMSENGKANKSIHYICADAEAIPLKENSVDLVVSNFAIQWCPDRQVLLEEIARVLVPGGRFVFSMPGADTLHELKTSWQQADPSHTHVNQFCEMDELATDVQHSPLQIEVLQSQVEIMRYNKLQELTHELKALGAHNVTDGRARQLTGKNTLKRLVSAYDEFRDIEGMLPATWNVIYGVFVNQKNTVEGSG